MHVYYIHISSNSVDLTDIKIDGKYEKKTGIGEVTEERTIPKDR